ncbi:interleukin-1 receptor-associated kinase 1-binding protein 1 homolog [Salvelinus namaycush]|uniref:Interleukin-1 receptor-associated kinase 1-binding protein 1 homolog n=1 Tax=Salvelinus namaycush TaxID=8040 RepID=A0A8U1BSW1_SALNM|nr:interleukin-1 receptor-associated kinase 1-binding protein 1 homolog [Salvelinus namaycush]
MASSPSRVFAALLPTAGDIYRDENEPGMGGHTVTVQRTQNSAREVQVTGSAEASCPADRATVSVSFRNSKESVNDVTNSISRRVEYILQTLRQHHVKGEELTVTRHIYRADDLYHMEALVMVVFSDFGQMERVCIVLLEKLDKSVCVSTPHFYHSEECLSLLRRSVCVAAVENARLKASEISSMLGQTLGHPLLVREEEATERDGGREGGEGRVGEGVHRPSISATSRVFVTFNLRHKDRTRKKI